MNTRRTPVIAAVAAAALLAGCTAGPAPKAIAVGGSKSDATVKMAARYVPGVHDSADWTTANAEASERCQVWGYERAEPFGSEFERCSVQTGGIFSTCVEMIATRSYQCVGETK
jgi:hypothetical protein